MCCHIYCAHLGAPWHQIVGASRAVFKADRESRYRYPLGVGVAACAKIMFTMLGLVFRFRGLDDSIGNRGFSRVGFQRHGLLKS